MQAYRPLVELAGIVDPVDRLERIDGAGLAGIHFDGVGGCKLAGIALIDVLRNYPVVLDLGADTGTAMRQF